METSFKVSESCGTRERGSFIDMNFPRKQVKVLF
ncbi:hypothetical protein F4694_002531 [Bacillus niacini]|uniref:Uncharacterized protein n=1 Tax=Neobacillus niacini TaxID=86668 RepID=A0A852TD92_9BACI|nr:hypothetical protein [Neobacillus niacini]